MKKIILILIAIFSMLTMSSCNQNVDPRLENVKFESKTFVYDGNKHSIYVENLPEEFTVSYSGNNVIEIGEYEVCANVFENQILVLTLKAKITIVEKEIVELPEELKGILFEDKEVCYDGSKHSVSIVNLPEGFTASYSGNNVSEVGVHTVTANIFNSNRELVVTITAKITILEKTTVELPLV